MNHRAKQGVIKDIINRYPQIIAYLGLVLVIIFALGLDARNQNADETARERQQTKDEVARCIAAVETREVLRSQVEAVYNLATSAVERDADAPPLTANELRQYNQYIERANNYRERQYKKIKPSPPCEKYVDDLNVEPPTPPIPPLTNKEVRR